MCVCVCLCVCLCVYLCVFVSVLTLASISICELELGREGWEEGGGREGGEEGGRGWEEGAIGGRTLYKEEDS